MTEATDIRQRAEGIAQALGEGWTYEEPEYRGARLIHEDGTRIWGHRVWNARERFEFTACIPNGNGVYLSDIYKRKKEITVTSAKTDAAIAKDITRRLLDNAREICAEVAERVKQHNERTTAHEATDAKVAALFGKAPHTHYRSDGRDVGRDYSGHDYNFTANANGPGRVVVTFRSRDDDEAAAVIRAIQAAIS